MKFLISMNNKMYSTYDAEKLMKTIMQLDNENAIDGAEIYIDMTNENEKAYCLNIAQIMKENKWILQLHSANLYNLSEEKLISYLNYYNKFAQIYNSKIKLTIHPAEFRSIEESTNETIVTLNFVNEYIKQNNLKLELLLENLNDHNDLIRCNILEVYKVIDKLNNLGITLDMGHYVYDYSNNYNKLKGKYIDKIKNIHIHDIDNNKNDHNPFYYDNVDIYKIIEYITKIDYNESVVLEYGLEYLKGKTFEERISEYILEIIRIGLMKNTIIKKD